MSQDESVAQPGGAATEEDDSEPAWMALGPFALFAVAMTVFASMPGLWQEYIVDYGGRRGSFITETLESFGRVHTLELFLVLALLTGIPAVISMVRFFRSPDE